MEQRIETLLTETKLNWRVRTEGVQTESGIILPNIAVIREDTNKVLGVHSDGYNVYQNEQLLELLDRVSGLTGLPIHKGGYFRDGQRVYIQLKSNDLKLGDDKIEGFITGINSFDGSTSLSFGPSNITISCQNSFFAAYRQMDTKVRHTANMEYKIEEICRRIEGTLEEEKQLFKHIERLAEVPFDAVLRERMTKALFDIKKDVKLNDEKLVSTQTRNKIEVLNLDMERELADKGNTMWGLFSGITRYTTHDLYKGNTDKAMENKMAGVYGNRERTIFNQLVEIADVA